MADKLTVIDAVPFDPNDGVTPRGERSTFVLPSAGIETWGDQTPYNARDYLSIFEQQVKSMPTGMEGIEVAKAGPGANRGVPTAYTYGHIAYMPDPQSNGLIEYPGIQPSALKKVVKENVVPQMIIGMRCADVQRYAALSDNLWKPGWQISIREKHRVPDESDLKDIRAAEMFLQNSCIDLEYDKARERDERKLDSFANFLDMFVRDTLTYGAAAVWTDCSTAGKVNAYALLPAGNVRLTGSYDQAGQFKVGGYMGNPKIFAALVNDTKEVVATFTRDECVYYVRNPRTDIDIYGYGYSEVEIAIRLIQGYQNALDLNIDVFNKSAVPNGILVLKGGQVTQKQLDLLNRMWTNLKKGVTKSWALPVLGLNEDSEIEVLDLSRLKGNDGYYNNFMNMLVGAFCTVYKFPVHRLGYRASGHGQDTKMQPDSSTEVMDADDPGLAPFLMHIELLLNQYMIWSRWPHLSFMFNGRLPKEDARNYEFRRNAMTYGEARIEADLQPVVNTIKGSKHKEKLTFAAELMSMAPIDPNLASIFQTIAAALVAAEYGSEESTEVTGNKMESKKDPAKSEEHGATSGVRRNSKAETAGK